MDTKYKYVQIFNEDQIRLQKLDAICLVDQYISKLHNPSSNQSQTTRSTATSGNPSTAKYQKMQQSEFEKEISENFDKSLQEKLKRLKPDSKQIKSIFETIKDLQASIITVHKKWIDKLTAEVIELDEEKRKYAATVQLSDEDLNYKDEYFNFKDEWVVLNLNSIIESCFANPKRNIHPTVKYASVIKFCENEKYDSKEKLLSLLETELPNCSKEFNQAKIKLYGTEGMRTYNNTQKWFETLRKSRWYGPFI